MGTPVLNKVEVSLNELLIQVAESFLVNCEAKHLSLDVKCPEEEVMIEVDVNKMLRVFENNGESVSEESQLHLFEAYYRGGADCGNTSNGTGLGLAIAKEIVQLHQGSLTVSNTEVGICFRLSLPYKSLEYKK